MLELHPVVVPYGGTTNRSRRSSPPALARAALRAARGPRRRRQMTRRLGLGAQVHLPERRRRLGRRRRHSHRPKLELPGNCTTRALPSKVPHMNIGKDGRLVCYGPAGGGYGNPLERDPAKVADDVLDEVISALRDHGWWCRPRALSTGRQRRGARRPHRLDRHTFGCGPLKAETRVRIP